MDLAFKVKGSLQRHMCFRERGGYTDCTRIDTDDKDGHESEVVWSVWGYSSAGLERGWRGLSGAE